MYEYITGKLVSLSPTTAIVEAGGIGYNISISLTTQGAIQGESQIKLYIHTYTVQDQTPTLYGFHTEFERALFRLLISISGVGGGSARIMLSSHTPAELSTIISTGNTRALTAVKGIGAKTAEVIIVKLRDKVISLSGIDSNSLESSATAMNNSEQKSREAEEALLVLGFNKSSVQKAIKNVIAQSDSDISIEDIIRKTLALL